MDTTTKRRPRKNREEAPSNKLREYRQRANMTQAQLAKRINVSQKNISMAETEGKGIGTKKWLELADIFDVDPRVLYGWNARNRHGA